MAVLISSLVYTLPPQLVVEGGVHAAASPANASTEANTVNFIFEQGERVRRGRRSWSNLVLVDEHQAGVIYALVWMLAIAWLARSLGQAGSGDKTLNQQQTEERQIDQRRRVRPNGCHAMPPLMPAGERCPTLAVLCEGVECAEGCRRRQVTFPSLTALRGMTTATFAECTFEATTQGDNRRDQGGQGTRAAPMAKPA